MYLNRINPRRVQSVRVNAPPFDPSDQVSDYVRPVAYRTVVTVQMRRYNYSIPVAFIFTLTRLSETYSIKLWR